MWNVCGEEVLKCKQTSVRLFRDGKKEAQTAIQGACTKYQRHLIMYQDCHTNGTKITSMKHPTALEQERFPYFIIDECYIYVVLGMYGRFCYLINHPG